MAFVEDHLIIEKAHITQKIIDCSWNGEDIKVAYVFFVTANVLCVLVSTLLTVYVSPAATGSGVAETMGILNGLNLDDVLWRQCGSGACRRAKEEFGTNGPCGGTA